MAERPHATESDDCWCNPQSVPVKREDGSVGWVVVHKGEQMNNEQAKGHISAVRQGIEDAIGELTVDGLRSMELTRVTKAVEVLRATVKAVDAAFSALNGQG